MPAARQLRRFSIALIGGLRAGGRIRVEDRLVRVSAIGGVDLDLREAELTGPRFTLVKVSLIGGVELTVPADARVEVHGLAIGGRRIEPATGDGSGAEIVVWNFGILGGVKVRRGASA